MKILVTGANGNLGQALKRKGRSLTIIPIGRNDWSGLDRKLEDADAVIHAASDLTASVAKDPAAVMDSNLMTTVQLLKSLAKTPGKRLFFVSSCAVYGRSEVTSEDIPPAPISLNGVTKLLNEQMISDFARAHKIDFQILRAFNMFGGQDRFSIVHHLQNSVAKRVPFTMFNKGRSQRDFVHVEDVAEILIQLLSKPTKYPVMNIGSGEATKIRDIVTEFSKKYPQLEVVHKERVEAEYSRADLGRFRELFPAYSFRSVVDFIREEI